MSTIKRPKYLYFIVVNLHGNDVLKFGISNKFERRFKEYRDPETVGYYVRVLSVFKTVEAKRIETALKWYMKQCAKPLLKQEYFELKWYEQLREAMKNLGSFFLWKYKEIDTSSLSIKRYKKKNNI